MAMGLQPLTRAFTVGPTFYARPCTVFQILDQIPLGILVLAALALGLAPFTPEPHLVEKLRMLAEGTLRRPIDIFDLVMHATPVVLLAAKLLRMAFVRG